ncbi:MAG: class I tRNA ligase family protein, partial [Candidatus Nomurabacteria bacterium]|nr:class I tRNA ligase family protein [Candidatus Nomurabacteria bacterium]
QVVARDFGEAHAGEVDVQGAVIVGYNPKTNKFLGMNSENGALSVWLPGGGLEKGETFDECARRELLEETGYRPENIIQIGNIFYSHYYNSRKDSYRRSFAPHYLAIIDDKDAGDSAQEEHEKFSNVWLDFDTMRQEIAKYGSDTEHWIYILDIAKRYIENGMKSVSADEVLSGEGIVINSGKFDGLPTTEAKEKIVSWLAKKGAAREKTQYKLRDWVYSRQHYWGEPIPIIHCDKCGAVPVPDADLPVELPPVDHYEPTDDGQSPLSKIDSWVNVKCPNCGGNAKRETDTMPNWAGSNWYYLRYFDAHNSEKFADPEKLKYWGEVDLYLGGMEHTTLHLLYSRFHHQFLYDQGLVPTAEPYAARRGQGIVLAADGRKMSKSLGNVVDPVQIIDSGYGADAVRLAVTFLAPYDQTTPWSPEGVAGTYRFLTRVWNLTMNFLTKKNTANDQDLLKIQHKTIKKVSEDLEKMNFNTAIAALMEYQNALARAPEKVSRENLETLLQLLAPFAPHIANELYEKLGNDQSVDAVSWPEYDPTLIVDDEITIAVQINGKLRGEIVVPTDADEETVKTAALALENVQNHLAGKKPARVIYVPGRVVNVVVK